MEQMTVKLLSAVSATESVYEAIIEGVGYKANSSGHRYHMFENPYDGLSQYTVNLNSLSSYTVKKHISSSPIATITFTIEIVRDQCMIRRSYASSNLTTYYSILKAEGDWALSYCHDGVLNKFKGYTRTKLDMDACQAYDHSETTFTSRTASIES